MLHAMRNDDEFSGANDLLALPALCLADLHVQFALDHHEQFVFLIMVMPHKVSFELCQLHLEIVQFAHDFGAVIIIELRKLLSKVDGLHEFLDDVAPACGAKYSRPQPRAAVPHVQHRQCRFVLLSVKFFVPEKKIRIIFTYFSVNSTSSAVAVQNLSSLEKMKSDASIDRTLIHFLRVLRVSVFRF